MQSVSQCRVSFLIKRFKTKQYFSELQLSPPSSTSPKEPKRNSPGSQIIMTRKGQPGQLGPKKDIIVHTPNPNVRSARLARKMVSKSYIVQQSTFIMCITIETFL